MVGTAHIHVAGTRRRNSHLKRQKKVSKRNAPGVTVAWIGNISEGSSGQHCQTLRTLKNMEH